jgi:hypothetical protein
LQDSSMITGVSVTNTDTTTGNHVLVRRKNKTEW